jgi:hypothetical protein
VQIVRRLFGGPQATAKQEPNREAVREQLWHVHDSLSSELSERRSRAGVLVGVHVAVLAAVIAIGFVDPELRTNQAVRLAYLIVVAYEGLSTLLALVAMNPGLPWERENPIHLVAWLSLRALGAGLPKTEADAFHLVYRTQSVAWVRFLTLLHRDEDDPSRVQADVAELSDEDIARSIVALALQIEQHRAWRRAAALASLLDVVLVTAVLLFAIGHAANATAVEICVAVAVSGALTVSALLAARLIGSHH